MDNLFGRVITASEWWGVEPKPPRAERGLRGGHPEAVRLSKELSESQVIIRPRDFQKRMGSHWWIGMLVRWKELIEAAPGLYVRPERPALASWLALARIRNSALGLTSALWARGLIETEPSPVHLLVPRGTRPPREKRPALCLSYTPDCGQVSGTYIDAFMNFPLAQACSVARALVDCLRYRCGPGEDRVLELVRLALSTERVRPSELHAALEETRATRRQRQLIFDAISSWRRESRTATP